MLAELVHHVIGVDPDRDWITLAVVDARSSGVVADAGLACCCLDQKPVHLAV